ncbi:hypothetical protein BC937DRAFT_89854 [Endogone sp. FLAS-F59071]|nr:hypothetical protein BC937DRAFT_89854 [Endogone sp. FLAS-F59071]|eukprot:RUS22279.1 hypothetical protein BC937DRAFT_89854 [Endogone sp. FLAS-F59071]
MKVSDIQSLVLVGGSVRIPAVQTILKEIVGEDKIAQNVNGDEAAVLGEQEQPKFRSDNLPLENRIDCPIQIVELSSLLLPSRNPSRRCLPRCRDEPPIQADAGDSDQGRDAVFQTTLFGELAPVGARKIMNFKRTTDFDFELKYGKLSEEDRVLGLADLAKVTVTGLTDITAKIKDPNAERPKVRVAIELSESGILSVTEATATVEAKEPEDKPTLAGMDTLFVLGVYKVKSFFGAGSSTADDTVSDEALPGSQETPALNASEQIKTNNGNTTQVNDTQVIPEKEVKLEKIQLTIKVIPLGIKPMEAAEKMPAAARLQSMDAKDRKRRAREEARNNVESFVYRTQDWLYDDTVQLVSTENQREQLRERLSETSEWLYGDGEQAQTEEYVAKLKDLQKLQKPIDFRRSENTKRPEAIKALRASISAGRTFLEVIRQNTTDEDRYHTDEELDRLEQLCDDTEDWLAARLREQEALKSYTDPILTSVDIEARQKAVDRETMVLLMRKPPKKEKKKAEKKEEKAEEEKAEEAESEERKSEEKPEEKAGDKEERGEKSETDKPPKRDEL